MVCVCRSAVRRTILRPADRGAGACRLLLVHAPAVEADDELVVIEAMKMQNLIYAPVAGTVKAVHVKQGDKVEPDDVLVIIE